MNRPRIALTGARGVLGRCLQAEWPEAEWMGFPGDIRDFSAVSAWLENAAPVDAIIHLAAIVPTGRVDADPLAAFQTNVGGTCNLLEAARLRQSHCWVFLGSSSHVYGSAPGLLAEDASLAPVSLYGRTKLQAEEWGHVYAERYGLSVCSGRIFSYSSSLQPTSYFLPALAGKIRKAPRSGRLEIPGIQGTRDFLRTRQITEAIRFLFEKRYSGIINIGTGKATKLHELAVGMRDSLGREDVEIIPLETGTAHLCADISKLRALGLDPSPDIRGLLEEIASTPAI